MSREVACARPRPTLPYLLIEFAAIFLKQYKRPLDLRRRTTTRTRFNLKFFCVLLKKDAPESLIVFCFPPERDGAVIVNEEGRSQNDKTSNI